MTMNTKPRSRQLDWYYKQNEPPIIEGVPVMPSRLIAPDASVVEQQEFTNLLPEILSALRAKRHQGVGHTEKVGNIRVYSTGVKYRCLVVEAA